MNKIFQFNRCLTNGMDYFIGADPYALLDFKKRNNLDDDLLTEFTTNDSGDNVVTEGIMIPLEKCAIVPHTIYVNFSEKNRVLTNEESDFQFKEGSYPLKIVSGIFCVFAIDYLENFTEEAVENIIILYRDKNYAIIDLDNGWYSVEILAGLTQQNFEKSSYHWGEIMDDMEPTFEFCLHKQVEKPKLTAKLNREYKIEINKDIYKNRRIFK